MTMSSYPLLNSLLQLTEAKLIKRDGMTKQIMLKGSFYLQLDELHSKAKVPEIWVLKRLLDDEEYAEVTIFELPSYKPSPAFTQPGSTRPAETTYAVRLVDLRTSDVLDYNTFIFSYPTPEEVLQTAADWVQDKVLKRYR